jgi:hypothetical protein
MFRVRWDVREFSYEEYYPITQWAALWATLPVVIIGQRVANLKTSSTHSSHIWEYLTSNGLGDYRSVLTRDQELFLYKNIQYIIKNRGKDGTLSILADHLLNTLKATQNSVYYRMLNPEEQFTVSTAAFFHDLRKRTGPPNLREAARICVDPHHPGRSAESVLEYLPNLGYTPKQVQDIYTLIDHHQLLGNMARPDASPTTPKVVRQAADLLGSASVLKMLRALTEGDVRCVRFDVPGRTWYDPDMIQRVYEYSQKVLEVLIQKEQRQTG